MRDLGPHCRTKEFLPSPLQVVQKEKEQRMEEDEPLDPREMIVPTGLMQQSQAMNALVDHLIGQQDPMLDLGSSSAGGLSLSSKGTRGRERLLQRVVGEERRFLPSGGPECFQASSACRGCSKEFAGVPEEGHLFQVPKKARRICCPEGHWNYPMASFSGCRCPPLSRPCSPKI